MYGLKDINAPFIQYKNECLGELWKETKRFAMFGIYRLEDDGWQPIAKKYFNRLTLQKNIITK